MVKGEDAVLRKRNKARRKKMNNKGDSSSVSSRIASIIAAKKRRKSGKRRICQGMCFSLPTADDPFNDRQGKPEIIVKEKKKKIKGRADSLKMGSFGQSSPKVNDSKVEDGWVEKPQVGKKESVTRFERKREEHKITMTSAKRQQREMGDALYSLKQPSESLDCPSKFLTACLNEIEDAFKSDATYVNQDTIPLFSYKWGFEFWECYLAGNDILETSGSPPAMEQLAWIVSTAADTMARKEKEGLLLSSPFLVFIVPSQEKAVKVRSVCKPLKSLGIHTVSLHSGASIDHQINGLKSCEPEFIVSTPERLLELVSIEGFDISGVSLLVIEELESLYRGGHLDTVRSIKEAISGRHQIVVFNDFFNLDSTKAVQSLLTGSVNRVSLNDSVASQSACITQYVNVCASNEEKLMKCSEVMDHTYYGNNLHSKSSKVLFIAGKIFKVKMGAIFKVKGYSISTSKDCHIIEVSKRTKPLACMIDVEEIDATDLGEYEVVILPEFVPSMERYVQILARMARYSVNGVLQSFLAEENAAQHAEPLAKILKECGQEVPDGVRELCAVSSSMSES